MDEWIKLLYNFVIRKLEKPYHLMNYLGFTKIYGGNKKGMRIWTFQGFLCFGLYFKIISANSYFLITLWQLSVFRGIYEYMTHIFKASGNVDKLKSYDFFSPT